MAIEKTKKDLKEKIFVEEVPKRKTKRNRRKTECSVNRRNGCGICGSSNICSQGVIYCEKCGEEKEFLENSISVYFYFSTLDNKICNCKEIYFADRKKPISQQRIVDKRPQYIGVGKCIDCGAVLKLRSCPNNPEHKCWTHWNNKKYCNHCGYRS